MDEIEKFLRPYSNQPNPYREDDFKKALIRALDNINNSINKVEYVINEIGYNIIGQLKKLRRPKFRGFK